MRVTDSMMNTSLIVQNQINQQRMMDLQQQATTLRRINEYADDPAGLGMVRSYETLLEQNAQYQRNSGRARTVLNATDAALQDMNDVLSQARVLAMSASSGTATSETNGYAVTELQGLIDQMLSLTNSEVNGTYIFAGHRSDVPPFVVSPSGEVVFQGDDGQISSRIGPSTELVVNVPGSELLGSSNALMAGSTDLSPTLAATDLLGAIGGGTGWTPGSILYTDASGNAKSVDLTGASDLQDVIDLLNAEGLAATLAPDGRGLRITDPAGGPLTITDPAGGSTALSLGIVGNSNVGVLDGSDIRPAPTASTLLSDIPSLAGNLPLGTIIVECDGMTATIDLSGVATVGHLETIFEGAVAAYGLPPLDLQYSSNGLTIVSPVSTPFTISEAAPGGTAAALGILGDGAPTDVFQVMYDLQTALNSNDQMGIRVALTQLESVMDHMNRLEVGVGGKQTMLDWADSALSDRDYELRESLSLIRDADLTKVATDLSQAEAAYQASLAVTSSLMQLSLFNYI